jgi:Zc3h12a-like ribonuclease protein
MAPALPPLPYMPRPNGRNRAESAKGAASRTVIIDGSNVAHSNEGDTAQLENIQLVLRKARQDGLDPVVLVDAALRHRINHPDEFERLVENGTIRQAPAGTDADYFILSFARELNADVVSNDRFRDRQQAFPEIRDRMIRYMIVNGEVVFERRNHRR